MDVASQKPVRWNTTNGWVLTILNKEGKMLQKPWPEQTCVFQMIGLKIWVYVFLMVSSSEKDWLSIEYLIRWISTSRQANTVISLAVCLRTASLSQIRWIFCLLLSIFCLKRERENLLGLGFMLWRIVWAACKSQYLLTLKTDQKDNKS